MSPDPNFAITSLSQWSCDPLFRPISHLTRLALDIAARIFTMIEK
jgi:hypothetical protein